MSSKPPKEAVQASILLLGRIASQVTEAIAPLLVTRLLGRADFGSFAAVMLVYSTAATLLTAGFPQAVLYFMAGGEAPERRALVRRLLQLNVLLGAALATLLIVIGGLGTWLAPATDERGILAGLHYVGWLAGYALLDLPVRIFPNILIAEGRARAAAAVAITRSLTSLLGTLIPASLGYGVPGIIVGQFVAGAVHLTVMTLMLRGLYAGVPRTSSTITRRQLFNFSFPVGLTDIVSMLNASLDMWLIALLFPAARVGEYRIGAWQIPVLTSIAYTTGAVYLPRLSQYYRDRQFGDAVELWRASALKTSLVVVPFTMIFIVGANDFIATAFPPEYAAAAGVFRCYCLLTLARVTAFGNLMLAAGKPSYVLRAAALSLVANAVICVPMAFAVGFMGPAIATVIAFVPTVWFYCFFIANAYETPLSHTFPLLGWLRVVAVAALPGVLAFWLRRFMPDIAALRLGIEAVIVLAGYSLLGTAFGLIKREDWRFAADWARLRVLR